MAQKTNKSVKWESLKRKLLLGFVFVSVLMIGAIWIDGIVETEPETPSYYRDSYEVDDSIYLTVTADALKYNPESAGTPEPHEDGEHHQGSGQGQGAGQGSGQGSSSGGGSDH
jgi:uncharacterized membrane protein YgcG